MSTPNWDEAPEDAVGFLPETSSNNPIWIKFDDKGQPYYKSAITDMPWRSCLSYQRRIAEYIKRPQDAKTLPVSDQIEKTMRGWLDIW